MDGCLLCLEVNNDVLDSIKVNSPQWQELNIQNLIEQHLWPIETATLSSYLCSKCWQELNDFHKFYTRIEEAQNGTIDSLVKIEIEPVGTSIQEVLSTDLIIEKEKIVVKVEPNAYLSEDDKPLMPCSKKEDPLNLPKKLKSSKKRKNGKKESSRDDSKTDPKFHRLSVKEMDKFIKENFKMNCSICEISFDNFDKMCIHSKLEHEQGYAICCSKKFFKRTPIFEHLHKHLDPNYLKCNDCGREMANRINLKVHMRTHGPREKNHCCDVCGLRFTGRSVLETHKTIHLSEEEKLFPCLKCGKKFGDRRTHKTHLRKAHGPGLSCDICGLIMVNKTVLLRHKRNIHPTDEKSQCISCPICSKILKNRESLYYHKRNHQRPTKHKCTKCPMEFKDASKLQDHMGTHTRVAAFRCTWCPKKFTCHNNMRAHRKRSHPEKCEEEKRKKYVKSFDPNNITKSTNSVNES